MTPGDATTAPRAPFPGPLPFLRADEPIFCGRERETSDLLDLLFAYRSAVLYAQSGAGKTSIVNAGIGPLLEREGFRVLRARVISDDDRAPPGVTIPNRFVWNALKSCIGAGVPAAEVAGLTISGALKRQPPGPLLFIVDQLEELFLPTQDGSRLRSEFFSQIKATFEGSKEERVADLHVLYVIREEYFPRLDRYAGAIPHACNIRYYLDRLTEAEARTAIAKPLGTFGYEIAKGALDDLILNLRRTRDANGASIVSEFIEPLELQIVCDQLWQKLDKTDHVITAADVSSYADVHEAARSYYERTLDRAVHETGITEAKLRAWCGTALITAAGARNLIFAGQTETQGLPNRAVECLVRDRLVHEESRPTGTWYELSHDRFVEAVRRSNEERERQLDRTLIRAGRLALPVIFGALILLGVLFAWHRFVELKALEEQESRALNQALNQALSIKNERDQDDARALQLLQKRLELLQSQSQDLEQLADEQAQMKAASEEKLAALKKGHNQEQAKRSQEIKALKTQIDESNARGEDLAVQRSQLSAQIAGVSTELSNMKNQLDAAKADLDQTRTRLTSVQHDLNAQLDICHEQLSGVRRDLETAQAVRASCLQESDALHSRATAQEQAITACTSGKQSTAQELATVRDQLSVCPKCSSYVAGTAPCPP